MRKIVVIDSLKVTFIVSLVVFMGFLFGDAFALPIQAGLGATSQEIHDSQNMTLFYQNIGFMILSVIGIFIVSLLMLNYLEHGKGFGDYSNNEYKNKRYNDRYF